ncbi:hypothetical protein [Halorussus salinisoli]|uniref:hypothetical protein n=1 Tax=Halorussus salinisoli TaxID=2558242 RepID=UPI0010C2280B|nr:hypothetical protein [Halorussus salinisoli]
MSKTETPTDGLTNEEFESALADLLRTASRNNVETTRSVDVATDTDGTEWMVEITRIDRHR